MKKIVFALAFFSLVGAPALQAITLTDGVKTEETKKAKKKRNKKSGKDCTPKEGEGKSCCTKKDAAA